MDYDYIVIGAGPAGCFAAVELKRHKKNVCILEKNAFGHRKVCGGGVSRIACDVLKNMYFPVERFESAGAKKIDKYYMLFGDKLKSEDVKWDEGEHAYGIDREQTDRIFQEFSSKDYQIPIFYENKVNNIERCDGGFLINGIKAKEIIIAVGVETGLTIDGEPVFENQPKSNRPFGVSCIIKAKPAKEGFYFFDWRPEFDGTYGWVFTVGDDIYNVGLWLKDDYQDIITRLDEFIENTGKELMGDEYEIISRPRGAFLGIGKTLSKNSYPGVYVLGDARNICNDDSGEGISAAVIEAKKFSMEIFGEDK